MEVFVVCFSTSTENSSQKPRRKGRFLSKYFLESLRNFYALFVFECPSLESSSYVPFLVQHQVEVPKSHHKDGVRSSGRLC